MKGPPFNREKDGKVRDRGGKAIELFPGVREALLEVHRGGRFAGTQLAIASRTPEIRWVNKQHNAGYEGVHRGCFLPRLLFAVGRPLFQTAF